MKTEILIMMPQEQKKRIKGEIKETNGSILYVNSLCMSQRKKKTAVSFQEDITALLLSLCLSLARNILLFSNQEGSSNECSLMHHLLIHLNNGDLNE